MMVAVNARYPAEQLREAGPYIGRIRFALADSPKQVLQEARRVLADRMDNPNEFQDVEAALPTFIFRNKRLRLAEPISKLLLGEARLLAGKNHHIAECSLLG